MRPAAAIHLGLLQPAQQEPFAVLQGGHLTEDLFHDRLAPGVDRSAGVVFSFRAIRCVAVAFLGIGPRGATGLGSPRLARLIAMKNSVPVSAETTPLGSGLSSEQ
ncbi:hypothetical protein GCG21_11725 [Pseudactinotalea sp. HY160]|uniref:hypothetical protein n=1 Tax=Pseudactinotalea sp. HY160 TaxID=2654490 RepID=UPI00128C4229|nr:hypothetical protein [Pseudactinotalea sp. HY160]MPV50661.1 hypothetical protein [Pseudactinotalea sp. HY160]